MFDRVHAGADRGVDARFAVRVRGDLHAQEVRRFDDRPHFFVRELLRVAGVADRKHAAGRGDLDQIGAVLVLVPDGLSRLVGAIDDAVHPGRRDPEVGPQSALIAMAAGDAEHRAGRPDTRARDEPAFDRALQGDVGAAVGADVPNRREPGLDRASGVDG